MDNNKMDKYSNLPISFLTDTAINLLIALCPKKTPGSAPLKTFLTLETVALLKFVATMVATHEALKMASNSDKLLTEIDNMKFAGEKTDIENYKLINASLDIVKVSALGFISKGVLPFTETLFQHYLMSKLDLPDSMSKLGLLNPILCAISSGLFALKIKEFNLLDEWSGFAKGVTNFYGNNFIDLNEVERLSSKDQNVIFNPKTQLLSQKHALDGYLKVSYLDLEGKKLCLDKTAQEQWSEVASNVKFTIIPSQSSIGIYDECPSDTVGIEEFIATNDDFSKVNYFVPSEALALN